MTPSVKKRYICNDCGMQFTNQSNCTRHKKIHSDKTYICKVCNRKFHRSDGLRNHIRTHSSARRIVGGKPPGDSPYNVIKTEGCEDEKLKNIEQQQQQARIDPHGQVRKSSEGQGIHQSLKPWRTSRIGFRKQPGAHKTPF